MVALTALTVLASPLLAGCAGSSNSAEPDLLAGKFVSGVAAETTTDFPIEVGIVRPTTTTLTAPAPTSDVPAAEFTATIERDGEPSEINAVAKTTRPTEPGRLAVAGMSATSHDGFDRVIIDLEGEGEPGWFVDYISSPVQAAGHPLEVAGERFLVVNIDCTVSPYEMGLGHIAERVDGSGVITEIVSGGTSDGRSQVFIGLDARAPFTVGLEHDPLRLIIDIAHSEEE